MDMFAVDDYVVNGSLGVCQIADIVNERGLNGEAIDYYILRPAFYTHNSVMMVKTPVNNPKVELRKIVTPEEAAALIASMPEQETIWIDNPDERYRQFRCYIKSGEPDKLVQVIKTIYLARQEKAASGKNLTRTDDEVMKTAEKQLNEEFALALDIAPEAVAPYIQSHLGADVSGHIG